MDNVILFLKGMRYWYEVSKTSHRAAEAVVIWQEHTGIQVQGIIRDMMLKPEPCISWISRDWCQNDFAVTSNFNKTGTKEKKVPLWAGDKKESTENEKE